MFVDHISYLAFQQYFIAAIVWCFSLLLLSQYLNIQHKEISNKKLKLLEETIEYLDINNKIPSMIDLRYKDGVAIKNG